MIQSSKKSNIMVKDLVITGLLVAIVFVSTYAIQFHLPISLNGGLIHCGNIALFLVAIVFGKKKGAIAGAFGMGLFDVVSQYMVWAPFTFVIRGLMGYIIGAMAHRNNAAGKKISYNVIGILLSAFILFPGYYFTQVFLYGDWITPFNSIPGDIVQYIFGFTALIVAPKVIKAYERTNR